MQTEHKRIDWVDAGKFFCILFVIVTHLESGSEALAAFYWPFFLNMFFFLAGYVYRPAGSFREHAAKKARGLLVPWFAFGYGSILLTLLTPFVDKTVVPKRLLWGLLQIRGMEDMMWFPAAMFMCFLPFYFFVKWDRPGRSLLTAFVLAEASRLYGRYMPGTVFPWGTNALPWHLEMIFPYMLWMLLGYWFRQRGEERLARWDRRWSRGIIWLAYLLVVFGNRLTGPGSFLDGLRKLPYLKELLGIAAMTGLCMHMGSNRFIRFAGANTLTYFALHGRIFALIQLGLHRFAGGFYERCLGNPWASSALAVVMALAISVILIAPAEIINRWFPWVLGRKKVGTGAV